MTSQTPFTGSTLRLQASSPADITRAAMLLRAGELVAMPTETVYGLAANALDEAAVAAIFQAKGRPQDNPLIVHVFDAAQVRLYVKAWPFTAQRLAEQFWPGPLTIILPRADCVPSMVSAGLSTLALRVPSHPAAQALLRAADIPLAAPSANRSGSPSPTLASHVLADLDGKIAAVLDAGPCSVGVESTVLSLTSSTPCLLRPGGISPEQLEKALGLPIDISPAVTRAIAADAPVASPGMKYKHYAPQAKLTLVQGALQEFIALAEKEQPDGLLCFDEDALRLGAWDCVCYGAQNNPSQQARRLFAALREVDALGWKTALVRCPSREGVGLAVYNRLLRAAEMRVR